jgi:hypothetical protein
MEFTSENILKLTRQLLPKGRAFKMPAGGFFESLEKGICKSEARLRNDALSIYDSILPDNDNFTAQDATDWEIRLGLIVNEALELESRKLAIKRKLNYPGTISGRQSASFLEAQLRAAGFDVYVHENYPTTDPDFWESFQFGDVEFGAYEFGGKIETGKIIVNYIDEYTDSLFAIGSNLKFTFFIGGFYLGDTASVDSLRKDEFRQLILKIKPAHTVGLLYVTYD